MIDNRALWVLDKLLYGHLVKLLNQHMRFIRIEEQREIIGHIIGSLQIYSVATPANILQLSKAYNSLNLLAQNIRIEAHMIQ